MLKKIILTKLLIICLIKSQSPDQIKAIEKVVKNKGLSKQQAIDAAKARGYTDDQIKGIEKKYNVNNESKNDDLIKNNSEDEFENMELEDGNSSPENEESLDVEEDLEFETKVQATTPDPTYFGYDIFQRDPSAFQSSSVGAVEPDYLIGPGDEIIVMLWGETQFRQVLTVNREGFIFIPEVGQVFVNGLNLNLLESKLFRVMSQSYASLNPRGGKSSTFLDVSLGNLRPLRIQVLGEVAQPGAYTVNPSATLFSSLYYFNGPTTLGSLRDIRLIRGGKEISRIDFYDYLFTGKKPKDQKLQLDDVIFIPKRMKTVTITGEINRPGIYELKPDETLNDIIKMAGDLKVTAYINRIQIDRVVPFNKREDLGLERAISDVNLANVIKNNEKYSLQDADRIQVFSILDSRSNTVQISGAVTRPGNYELRDSLFLKELIEKADGLLGDAYLKRVDIIRIMPNLKEQLIKLNLEKVFLDDKEQNIQLQNLDRIRIFSLTEMVSRNSVEITGHVKNPGKYALQDGMRIKDIIFKSGGFVDEEFLKRTYLGRADLIRYDENKIKQNIMSFNLGDLINNLNNDKNFLLMPGDVVKIYPKTIFKSVYEVTVLGAVKEPGSFTVKNEMSLRDLILEAGGFDKDVYRYRIEISRIDPDNKIIDVYSTLSEIFIDRDFFESYTNISDDEILSKLNPKIMPYDIVFVRPDPNFSMQRTVSIEGMVMYPGVYPMLGPNETIRDVIQRAGGPTPNAYLGASKFIRNGVEVNLSLENIYKKKKDANSNFKVSNGDQIVIAGYSRVFSVLGEINSPGQYPFSSKKRIDDALRLSGGLTPEADKKNIFITFLNGNSEKYNRIFNNPKLMDGSIITVGRKPEEEPFNRTEYAKELTSIIANIAQAISLVVLARN